MSEPSHCKLEHYRSTSGSVVPVWTIEVQTVLEDAERLLDAVEVAHSLRYGRYRRNASISAVGMETAVPLADSTTANHVANYTAGEHETYPMVELKFSIERNLGVLERVMDAIHAAHHYEEPVVYIREAWASRANYDPNSDNPNRFWNNGRGLPPRIRDIAQREGDD